jgi:hypothetical protein
MTHREKYWKRTKGGITAMFVIAATLCGCVPARVVTKTVPVEVTKYVYKPLPSELTRACTVQPTEPACTRNGKPELCNDQLLSERNAYRTELEGCDSDKTEIRKLQPVTP